MNILSKFTRRVDLTTTIDVGIALFHLNLVRVYSSCKHSGFLYRNNKNEQNYEFTVKRYPRRVFKDNEKFVTDGSFLFKNID